MCEKEDKKFELECKKYKLELNKAKFEKIKICFQTFAIIVAALIAAVFAYVNNNKQTLIQKKQLTILELNTSIDSLHANLKDKNYQLNAKKYREEKQFKFMQYLLDYIKQVKDLNLQKWIEIYRIIKLLYPEYERTTIKIISLNLDFNAMSQFLNEIKDSVDSYNAMLSNNLSSTDKWIYLVSLNNDLNRLNQYSQRLGQLNIGFQVKSVDDLRDKVNLSEVKSDLLLFWNNSSTNIITEIKNHFRQFYNINLESKFINLEKLKNEVEFIGFIIIT